MGVETRIQFEQQSANAALLPWIARAKALKVAKSEFSGKGLSDIALGAGAPSEVAMRMKSATPAEDTTGQATLAGSSAAATAFVASTAKESIMMRLISEGLAAVVPFHTPILTLSQGAVAGVVDEGQPIPTQQLGTLHTKLTPEKIAAMVVFTEELWGDISAAGQAFVTQELRSGVAKVADQYMLDKLQDGAAIPSVGAATDDLLAAIRSGLDVTFSQARNRIIYGFGTRLANALATRADLPEGCNPFNGVFLGRPAVVSDALPDSRGIVINAQAILANLDAIRVDASNEAALQLRTDPTSDETELVSLFQTHLVASRVYLDLAVEPVPGAKPIYQFEVGGL